MSDNNQQQTVSDSAVLTATSWNTGTITSLSEFRTNCFDILTKEHKRTRDFHVNTAYSTHAGYGTMIPETDDNFFVIGIELYGDGMNYMDHKISMTHSEITAGSTSGPTIEPGSLTFNYTEPAESVNNVWLNRDKANLKLKVTELNIETSTTSGLLNGNYINKKKITY